jgi:UDP-glucose 4-epimerase
MSENILITGGAGFIGLHLGKRLLENGYRVHLVDNFSRAVRDDDLQGVLQHPAASISNIDCLDAKAIGQLPLEFNAIFHLAAIIGVAHVTNKPYRVMIDNMRLLDNLIAHAHRQTRLSRFLFASTSEVYAGALENFELMIPTPEEVPLAITQLSRPRTSYMLSKVSGEALCHYSDLPFTIFRPHNVYGPRMGSIHVIPEQLRKAYDAQDGDTIDVSSVDHTRCFCYVDDAVEMLIRMMRSPECEGQTLNLGVEKPEVTIEEVVTTCWEVVGRKLNLRPLPATLGSPARRAPNAEKNRRLTCYEPQVPLREGITRTYDWYFNRVFKAGGVVAQ